MPLRLRQVIATLALMALLAAVAAVAHTKFRQAAAMKEAERALIEYLPQLVQNPDLARFEISQSEMLLRHARQDHSGQRQQTSEDAARAVLESIGQSPFRGLTGEGLRTPSYGTGTGLYAARTAHFDEGSLNLLLYLCTPASYPRRAPGFHLTNDPAVTGVSSIGRIHFAVPPNAIQPIRVSMEFARDPAALGNR